MDWYRIYNGLPTDPRLPVIARRTGLTRAETLALWITLYDYASRQKPRGTLYGLDAEETAVLLQIDSEKTEAALDAFYEKGMIDIENNISDWARQQYKSTDRVRAHRARKKQYDETAAAVTADIVTTKTGGDDIQNPDDQNEIAARRARLQKQSLRRNKLHAQPEDV